MLYTLLSSLGLMYIIKYGTILDGLRAWLIKTVPWTHQLLQCSLCLGFWTGVVTGIVSSDDNINLVLFPWASAAWCWSCDTIHDLVVTLINHLRSR
jgi:hypothetical protein